MRRRSRPLFCPAGRLVEVSPGPQGCRKTTFSKAENRPYRNGKCGRGSSHQQSIRDKSTTFLIGTNTTGKILCCHPYHAFNRLPTADTTMLDIGPQNISSGKPAGHVSNVQMLTLGPVWKHTGRVTKKTDTRPRSLVGDCSTFLSTPPATTVAIPGDHPPSLRIQQRLRHAMI